MLNRRKKKYEEIPSEPHSQIILTDQEELCIAGYRKSFLKKCFFYLLNLPICGAAILLLDWYPQFIYLKHVKSSLKNADNVLVKDSNDVYSVHPVNTVKVSLTESQYILKQTIFSLFKNGTEFKYFIHKELRYYIPCNETQFYHIRGCYGENRMVKDLIDNSQGFTAEEQIALLKIYGRNDITVQIEKPWKLLFKEITRPFYLFQIFAITVWMINDYIYYALSVIVLSSWSIFVTLYSAKKQRRSIQCLVKKSSANVVSVIRRGGSIEKINPSFLVPGDIINIPRNGCVMSCDALLLLGNCIVNESTLTGESCPVMKTPAPPVHDKIFNPVIFKNHVLFSGTRVVQTRYYGEGTVTALIVNTGFSTIKGELVRCLLHPKPLGFKFYEDSIKFIFCLFVTASCGIFYMTYISLVRKAAMKNLVLDSLDLITIVVPPSLPAALSTGIAYSRSRLFCHGIFCMSPSKINLFGKLKLMCFDKTGTLTEEGLNLWGIIPCENRKFEKIIEHPSVLGEKHPLVVAFATCHSLTKINGRLCGDSIDLSMFNSIDWELIEPGKDTHRYDLLCPAIVKPRPGVRWSKQSILSDKRSKHLTKTNGDLEWINMESSSSSGYSNNAGGGGGAEMKELPYEIGIVREFPFTSSSRCMSVITRELGSSHMNLYCKGAPERIYELCSPESLPKDFSQQLQAHAAMGFRVLGLGYKTFSRKFTWPKSQRVRREEVECDLIFLGFIIMQNKLKPVSTAVVNELRAADIRCIMITGDNISTAISVSRECMMILPDERVVEVKVDNSKEPCKSRPPKLSFHPMEVTGEPAEDPRTGCSASPRCHYAIEGKTWELLRTHFHDWVPRIIVNGTVFARMLPEQKTQVIQSFQDLDYVIGMCGDGANDFGAMKAAHVGVSLSEAESSVAAPFTSKVQDISCIVTLIQEGRCALVSTFVIFKYMAIYGLIQFISVIIAFWKGVCFSNAEFLFVDVVVTSLLAIVIGKTGPAKTLVKARPIARLMSAGNLLPLFFQVIVLFSVQMLALEFLKSQEWFSPVVPGSESVTECWENTVIYSMGLFQFIILAVVYSKGTPYRQPFYKDVTFMIVLVLMIAFSTLFCVYPFRTMAELFEIIPAEEDTRKQSLFRVELLLFPLLNLLLSIVIEVSMSERKWLKKLIRFGAKKKMAKNRYKRILLDADANDCE